MMRQIWNRNTADLAPSRTFRRSIMPSCEILERKTMLSGSTVSIGIGAAALNPSPRYHEVHQVKHTSQSTTLGTVSGTITNTNGAALNGVRVQLINQNGFVVATTVTGVRGRYQFKIGANGAYVVRAVTPPRWTQTSPTFADTKPVGNYATGDGATSWSYDTGNSNPAFGPVGVYAWDTVAPAGELPFESPINISTPPIDLRPYLSINYNSEQAEDVINNGHQIQVQFSGSSADTIDVGGTPFELAQFHYHDPSENQVYGNGYSMEAHFVNESASGAETVVAVFLQLGAYNSALQPILNAATGSLTTSGSSTQISTPIDFAGLLPTSMQGWFYEGSLTTPTLAQPVNWFVLSTPITLDSAQLQQYESVASDSGFLPNARPVQPLDGRQVNQFNFDVNFQNQSVSGLTFTLARKS